MRLFGEQSRMYGTDENAKEAHFFMRVTLAQKRAVKQALRTKPEITMSAFVREAIYEKLARDAPAVYEECLKLENRPDPFTQAPRT